MEGKNSVTKGFVATAVMWGVMILSSIIDKYVIGEFALALITFVLAPLGLFVWYVIQCIKNKPNGKSILIWHLCYSASFFSIWIIGYFAVMLLGVFFPSEKSQSGLIDLSAGGVTWYGLTALVV